MSHLGAWIGPKLGLGDHHSSSSEKPGYVPPSLCPCISECFSVTPIQRTNNPGDGALFVYPAFPHTEHAPSCVPQSTCYSHVSAAIRNYLGLPECFIAFRGAVAPRASVPEASIDEESDFGFGPREVGPPKDWPLFPEPKYSSTPEQAFHFAFGRPARRSDGCHNFRADFSRYPVHRSD